MVGWFTVSLRELYALLAFKSKATGDDWAAKWNELDNETKGEYCESCPDDPDAIVKYPTKQHQAIVVVIRSYEFSRAWVGGWSTAPVVIYTPTDWGTLGFLCMEWIQ